MDITGNREKLIMALLAQPEDKLFDLKDHKEKRSLDANAYAWVLMGKIADALRSSKQEVYELMLKRYGQGTVITFLHEVNPEGYIEHFEYLGEGREGGIRVKYYKVFKGSSQYDTREMAILIDGIVSEAQELGIETMPPDEIKRLTEKWAK